jgi:DNA-binding NtrC family response regulator
LKSRPLNKTRRALVISEEPTLEKAIGEFYEKIGWEWVSFSDEHAFPAALRSQKYNHLTLAIADFTDHAEKILNAARELQQHLPVSVIYEDYNPKLYCRFFEAGAFNILHKKEWLRDSSHWLEHLEAYLETVEGLPPSLLHLLRPQSFGYMTGNSIQMQRVFRVMGQVMHTDQSVAIYGESGTGKELAARMLHENSRRAQKPFVAINCAAVPENLLESELFGHEKGSFTGAIKDRIGKFEFAKGGTIFLDEIGEMSQFLQAKLLRILEQGEYEKVGSNNTQKTDVRILTATNRDLMEAIRKGRFRQDLYYRINVFPIFLPPLRLRDDDVLLLAYRYVMKHSERQFCGIAKELINFLREYQWTGNVRELENILQRLSILSGGKHLEMNADIEMPQLVEKSRQKTDSGKIAAGLSLAEMEKQYLLQTLEQCDNNISETARMLDISRVAVYRKLNQYGIAIQKDEE